MVLSLLPKPPQALTLGISSVLLTIPRDKACTMEAGSPTWPGIRRNPKTEFSVPTSRKQCRPKCPGPSSQSLPQRETSVLFLFCFLLLLSFLYIGRAGLSVTSSTGALHPSLVSQHGCRDASSCRRAPDWLACRAERDAGGVTRQSQSAAVQGGPAAQTRGGRTECTWLE